jgi:hypothetical protein
VKEHIDAIHLKKKRYQCLYNNCNKKFSQRNNTIIHIQKVHLLSLDEARGVFNSSNPGEKKFPREVEDDGETEEEEQNDEEDSGEDDSEAENENEESEQEVSGQEQNEGQEDIHDTDATVSDHIHDQQDSHVSDSDISLNETSNMQEDTEMPDIPNTSPPQLPQLQPAHPQAASRQTPPRHPGGTYTYNNQIYTFEEWEAAKTLMAISLGTGQFYDPTLVAHLDALATYTPPLAPLAALAPALNVLPQRPAPLNAGDGDDTVSEETSPARNTRSKNGKKATAYDADEEVDNTAQEQPVTSGPSRKKRAKKGKHPVAMRDTGTGSSSEQQADEQQEGSDEAIHPHLQRFRNFHNQSPEEQYRQTLQFLMKGTYDYREYK